MNARASASQQDDQPKRLDERLVELGHYASRSRARDAIQRGAVSVDGRRAAKAGQPVAAGSAIGIDDPAQRYVSRAALKLVAGLDAFGFDPTGATALDVGASTGGFSQVLLERGAASVLAIDVGHGQLDPRVRTDPRVISIEGLNARDLKAELLQGRKIDFLVCDVSFISLTLALPPALDLVTPGAKTVLLVKPQFEVGRDAIGKGGLLKRPADGEAAAERLQGWLGSVAGWRAVGLRPSPIDGGDGNREFLLGGIKDR